MSSDFSGDSRFLPSRRRFVQGLAAGGSIAGLGLFPHRAHALESSLRMPVLSGTEFDLSIGETLVDFTGRVRPAVTVNGSLPAPLLRWREGDTVTLRVRNALPPGSIHGHEASIHWHGLLLPANMDGVPGLSFAGIHRGESYLYRFDVKQAGTYWYHSHSGLQEQAGHLLQARIQRGRTGTPVPRHARWHCAPRRRPPACRTPTRWPRPSAWTRLASAGRAWH